MTIKFLARERIEPLYLDPGDILQLSYNNEPLLAQPIERAMTVDELGVIEFEDEFGMKEGVGGIFGKSTT